MLFLNFWKSALHQTKVSRNTTQIPTTSALLDYHLTCSYVITFPYYAKPDKMCDDSKVLFNYQLFCTVDCNTQLFSLSLFRRKSNSPGSQLSNTLCVCVCHALPPKNRLTSETLCKLPPTQHAHKQACDSFHMHHIRAARPTNQRWN